MTEESEKTTPPDMQLFIDEFETLLKKYEIDTHAAIFKRSDSDPILLFGPNVIIATKLLNNAHTMCRNKVMKLIGE